MKNLFTRIWTIMLLGFVLPSASVTSANAASSQSVGYVNCPGGSPKAVVRGYYAAIIHHRVFGAKSCLTPYYLKQLTRVVDPDWQNIESIRSLKLKQSTLQFDSLPGNVPAAYAKPYAFVQIVAEFMVHYYRVESSPNGPTIRFIYVVKQHRTSPWRIAAIGSGP